MKHIHIGDRVRAVTDSRQYKPATVRQVWQASKTAEVEFDHEPHRLYVLDFRCIKPWKRGVICPSAVR